ncbi:SDR family NAD(P)-dependent oxidoreductase [Roseburia sp. 499]|uniref:SDR family NAD(P)-dependent oxidoreductase n=1 Tax=Roseburia sp. 499 TaxID=1261634 RepID=UPI002ED554DF|nr:SDR family oxidoreductase [Roseburia sp. 499]
MKTVLITGGTSGIGKALVQHFLKEDYQVVLVASNQEKLAKTKDELEDRYREKIYVYAQDLAQIGAAQELYKRIKEDGLEINILINNAGIGLIGSAENIDFGKEEQMMQLNMITVVQLCRLFLVEMYERKEGKILNVASTGAFQPGPYTASYYATKSFVLSYSRAIRREAAKNGVQVCTLCPGTTDTEFFHRTGKKTPAGAMPADKVAEYAYKKLMKNKEIIVPGFLNRLLRVVPVRIKMFFVAIIKNNA